MLNNVELVARARGHGLAAPTFDYAYINTLSGAARPARRCVWRPPLQVVRQYLECLKRTDAEASACAQLSRRYLECRMER